MFDPGTMLIDGGDGRIDGTGAYQKEDAANDGTVYMVMGSSRKLGSGSLDHPVMYISQSQRGSIVLDIDGDTMDITMIRDNQTITDYFTLVKQPPGPIILLSDSQIDRTVFLGDPLPDGSFTVSNAGVDTHVATISVASPEAGNSPQTLIVSVSVESVGPDFDGDKDVDQADYGYLQACLSGPGVSQDGAACQDAKLDGDSDVDSGDVSIFLACQSGAGIPAERTCDN